MKPFIITAVTAALVIAASPVYARTWNVPVEAPTIAAGLDSAVAGDTVLVACDTYYENALSVPSGVVLRSATGDPSCVTIDGTDGRGTVLALINTNSNTRVEGFTITGGSGVVGGGMYCRMSGAVVRDCAFVGNSASNSGGGVYVDGTLYYFNSMDFIDCSFNGNTAGAGGAVAHKGEPYSSYYNATDFIGCTFDQNSATYDGGAVYGYYCAQDFDGCTFDQNSAGTSGGGVFSGYAYWGASDFTSCTFSGNTAAGMSGGTGGGVCFYAPQYYDSYDFVDCTFSNNSATQGGGVGHGNYSYGYMYFAFDNCVFAGNSADEGGGVYTYYSGWDFTDCSFKGNSASDGGAAYVDGTVTYFTSSDFIGNTASNHGGAAYSDGGYTHFYNNTLYGNSAMQGAGLYSYYSYDYLGHTIVAFSPVGEAINCDEVDYPPYLWCCDLYGNAGGDWVDCIADQYGTNGNIAEDPMFCCGCLGDLRIDYWSPCRACSELPNDLIGNHGVGCRGNRCEQWQRDTVRDDLASVLEEQLGGGTEFRVLPPAPNPFNPSTEIVYSIPAGADPGRVTMNVYDAAGRRVTTLVDADQGGGMYRVVWDGRDDGGAEVASGVYFYRTTWNGESETKRMVLLK